MPSPDFEARFWGKVDTVGVCWQWSAATDSRGYGRVRHQGDNRLAHRVAYEALVGPVPDGLVLDHLCRNHGCVNPDHLEPVAQGENVRRGNAGWTGRSKTHCPQGHPYDELNTIHYKGERRCKACKAENQRRRRQRFA